MSEISVLLSGLPPAGGFGSPPKIPVTRRMNVLRVWVQTVVVVGQ